MKNEFYINDDYAGIENDNISFYYGYEHEYCKKYNLNQIRIKREFIHPEGKETKEEYSDIKFNLDPEQFKMFCEFFNNINGGL